MNIPFPLFTFLTVGTNLNQQLAAYGLKMSTMLNVNIKTFLDQRKKMSFNLPYTKEGIQIETTHLIMGNYVPYRIFNMLCDFRRLMTI